ncbi:MAG: hypothetical protein M1820_002356 [Bogoriella megaspora]|nr:MAG: hypothetical protein M1820_002356 [Bogoriella megaspora]
MHPSRIFSTRLHRIRTAFSSNSSTTSARSTSSSKSPLSSSSSFVEPTSFPPTTSHSSTPPNNNHMTSPNLSATTEFSTTTDFSTASSVSSSINQAILLMRRPSSMELELEEERKLFGGLEPEIMEPRPRDRSDVGVMPFGGMQEIMGGR